MGKITSDPAVLAQEVCSKIEGWLDVSTATITIEILNFQAEKKIRGGLLELGVHKGRYLSLIYTAHANDENVVGVDAFFERLGVPLEDKWRDHAIEVIKDNVASISGENENLVIIPGLTNEISSDRLKGLAPYGYRFISIDAGHDSESVFHDLYLSTKFLADGGVIAIDDLFNPLTPGVSEGFFRWAIGTGGMAAFAPIAYFGNKVFMVKGRDKESYFDFFKNLLLSQKYEFMEPGLHVYEENSKNNYSPTFLGNPYLCLSHR